MELTTNDEFDYHILNTHVHLESYELEHWHCENCASVFRERDESKKHYELTGHNNASFCSLSGKDHIYFKMRGMKGEFVTQLVIDENLIDVGLVNAIKSLRV